MAFDLRERLHVTSGRRDRRRLLVPVALLVGVIGVTTVAAGEDAPDDVLVGVGLLPELLLGVLGFISLLVLILMVVAAARPVGPVEDRPSGTKRLWALVAIAALVLVLALWPRAEDDGDDDGPAVATSELPADTSTADPRPVVTRSQAAALATLLVASVAAIVWARSRTARSTDPPAQAARAAERFPAAVRAANRRLDDDQPRAAVIAAYAELEEALTELGLGRRPTETPTEHMRRVGPAVSVRPEALARLARLYELARFSRHGFAEDHVREARSDLRVLTEDLARAGTGPR